MILEVSSTGGCRPDRRDQDQVFIGPGRGTPAQASASHRQPPRARWVGMATNAALVDYPPPLALRQFDDIVVIVIVVDQLKVG
jgi:hypothetical protein